MAAQSSQDLKVKLIADINRTLLSYGKAQISPKDFDILYDLTINELIEAKKKLANELKGIYASD